MDSRDVGRRVRAIREARSLEQSQLAEMVGMSRAYVYRLESGGIINPKLFDLSAIADALQVPLDALLRDPTTMTDDEQAELQDLLADADMRKAFATTYRDSRVGNWSDADKRFVLNALRAARELINERRRTE